MAGLHGPQARCCKLPSNSSSLPTCVSLHSPQQLSITFHSPLLNPLPSNKQPPQTPKCLPPTLTSPTRASSAKSSTPYVPPVCCFTPTLPMLTLIYRPRTPPTVSSLHRHLLLPISPSNPQRVQTSPSPSKATAPRPARRPTSSKPRATSRATTPSPTVSRVCSSARPTLHDQTSNNIAGALGAAGDKVDEKKHDSAAKANKEAI